MNKLVVKLLVFLIRLYQVALSPLFPPTCRFYPSCSHYAVEALIKHGAIRGSYFATRRLFRCHPFNDGGYDPVPHSHSVHSTRRSLNG